MRPRKREAERDRGDDAANPVHPAASRRFSPSPVRGRPGRGPRNATLRPFARLQPGALQAPWQIDASAAQIASKSSSPSQGLFDTVSVVAANARAFGTSCSPTMPAR